MGEPIIRWWRVDLGEAEASALCAALSARRVTMGPLTAELEARLAVFLGVPHCVLVNNGASALVAALLACGVGPGDEVVVPGLTFIATANAARMLGARVRLVDVRPDRPLMDPAGLSAVVGPETRVIVPVHLGGRAADLAQVREAAAASGARVVEDAAQALGSRDAHGFLGTRSDLGCFSLGVTKLVTTGEGGAVVTRDPDMDRRLKGIRNNGAVSLADNRFEGPGLNFRPLDLLAAMGLARMATVERTMERLRAVYRRYRDGLAGLGSVRLIPVHEETGEVPLWVEALAVDRDAMILGLAARGIEARPYPPALCDVEALGCPEPLPYAKYFAAHGLVLPSGPDRDSAEVDRVLEVLADLDRRAAGPVPDPPRHRSRAVRPRAATRLDDPCLFRRDDSGRSPAFFALDPVRTVDSWLLDELEPVAARQGGVARICLHADPADPVQDMIIAKTRAAPVRPGQHRSRSQTLQVLRGRLAVLVFEGAGTVTGCHILDPECPVLRIEAGTDYADFPRTEVAVYREVLAGPHEPGEWVEATWWPPDQEGRARLMAGWRDRAGG